MNGTNKFDWPDHQNSTGALHAVSPIIRSAVGVVRESAGLLCNVAALGFEAPKKAPRRPVTHTSNLVSNVIPFPTARSAKQKK